jgi:hypothetical protein
MRDFREAEALARSQGARGFQLRAATSILEAAAGVDVAPALQALRFLLATFTEGQQTRDYLTAERLISEKASIAGFSG